MKSKYILSLYFLSLLGMGVFHAAITPIFEGFDENAHYSWIRQIAYQGNIPARSEISLDQMIVDYQGPIRYSSGNPPFDSDLVYAKFFSNPDLVDKYTALYRQNILAKLFVPSQVDNWQSQHPPLYYALMAPILRLIDNHALVSQVFILRIASYLLALVGVLFGILAIRLGGGLMLSAQSALIYIGFIVYPLIFPMFFPEFARIGNDSLCLLLVGLVVYFSSRWMAGHGGRGLSVALGVTLGLGLLTKALFIPVVASSLIFLLIWSLKNPARKNNVNLIMDFTYVCLPALIMGGGWYLYNYFTLGNFSGSNVAVEMVQRGGFLANVAENISILAFFRGMGASLVTFIWGGSWSLVHLPHILYIPPLMGLIWIVKHYWGILREESYYHPRWMVVWLVIFFVLGLSWYAIVSVALGSNANTPGWYFHILMPFTAPAIGLGLLSILQNSRFKYLFWVFLAYSVCFYLYALWAQLALFSGCAIKGDDKQYSFLSNSLCIDQAVLMIDRLDVLVFPLAGVMGLGCWLICSFLLVIELRTKIYLFKLTRDTAILKL